MGLKSTSSPWKCFIVLKLIGRVFWGSKLLNRQIFMEPGILTIPAYSLGVLIEVQFATSASNRGQGKTVEFPRGKKTRLWLEWNTVCERLLGNKRRATKRLEKEAEFGVVDVLKGILILAFLQRILKYSWVVFHSLYTPKNLRFDHSTR